MGYNEKRDGWNIDFGSVVIGFLLAFCLVLAVGAATGGDSAGPYRISSGCDTSAFVLDTETGHVWQLSRSDNIDLGTPLNRKSIRKSITPMLD
ncbi:MAG TPA: hypothetical protein VJJ98_06910 [Sedimentisphaerales bacterium]|nr:hypothetical protein [Sedimentisphaerales bacterium]